MKLYLSGPMRNIPCYNFPLFDEVAEAFRQHGYAVWSPADGDRLLDPECETRPGFAEGHPDGGILDINDLMRLDIRIITQCEGIALLPGWENSKGANIELQVARDCGLEVMYVVDADGFWTLEPEQKPTLIGLCGYAQTGKDTMGRILVEEFGFERIAFADPLRDMLYALNPLLAHPRNPLHDVRTVVDEYGWEWAKANTDVRGLLQRLGTEAGRNVLGDDIWVRTAMAKVKPYGHYVFTDVRFPNEANAIVARGGTLWRMQRAGKTAVNAHPSETMLDRYDWPLNTCQFSHAEEPDPEVLRQVMANFAEAALA